MPTSHSNKICKKNPVLVSAYLDEFNASVTKLCLYDLRRVSHVIIIIRLEHSNSILMFRRRHRQSLEMLWTRPKSHGWCTVSHSSGPKTRALQGCCSVCTQGHRPIEVQRFCEMPARGSTFLTNSQDGSSAGPQTIRGAARFESAGMQHPFHSALRTRKGHIRLLP